MADYDLPAGLPLGAYRAVQAVRKQEVEIARLREAVRELGAALGLAEERLPEWPMGYRQSVRAVLRKHAPLIAECKAEKEG